MTNDYIKIGIEFSVLSILAISLLAMVYLTINRYSAFAFVESQLDRFPNKTELEIELNKKMTMIYSIASNAVYIGLFGTVLGIIYTLAQINTGNQKELISSLSMPLISTAVSIVVAVVGTFLYNALVDRIEVVSKKWDIHHGHSIVKTAQESD
jgi:biopolymer transport protein ExbB